MSAEHLAIDHIGIAVPNLRLAMAQLSSVFGVGWTEPLDGRFGDWTTSFAFSTDSQRYIELIEGSAGSPWHAPTGGRLDHLAFRTPDPETERRRLGALGLRSVLDFAPIGLVGGYNELPAVGTKVEVIPPRDDYPDSLEV